MKRSWQARSRLLPPVLDCPPRMAGGLVPLPKASGGSRPVPPQQQQALESSSCPAQSVVWETLRARQRVEIAQRESQTVPVGSRPAEREEGRDSAS